MDPRIRLMVVILLAAVVAGLVVMLFVKNASVPGDSHLEGLISLFMKECLPDELSDAQRTEIEGIMDRFYAKAVAGRVYPEDRAAIENDIHMYIDRGGITRLELNDFMSKVGKATRRMDQRGTPEAE
ncbi:MAG: hypothetical protein JSW50_00940 [Candidatus Latescibacterota bacterium]|nr:MAG: hypothetical protein JSW50_00940 [Candidatus Latescibacterota bacterium]